MVEDFYNDYWEFDPDPVGKILRYSDQTETIYVRNFGRDQVAYVRRDFGVDAIGNFRLRFEFAVVNAESSNCWWVILGVANSLGAVDTVTGGEILLRIGTTTSSTVRIARLYEYDDGAEVQQGDKDYAYEIRRHYWCVLTRVGNLIQLSIFSDPTRETLLETITMTGATELPFRYFYACQSMESGSSVRQMNGYNEYYDFEWLPPAVEDLFCKFVVNHP